MTHQPNVPHQPDPDVPGWAIRLEAKIDVALAHHSAELTNLDKEVEVVKTDVKAIDARVDTIERSNYITPKGLFAAIAGSLSGTAAFIAVLDRLFYP